MHVSSKIIFFKLIKRTALYLIVNIKTKNLRNTGDDSVFSILPFYDAYIISNALDQPTFKNQDVKEMREIKML